MKFSLIIKGLIPTLSTSNTSYEDNQHDHLGCHYAECHYVECHYVECRGTFLAASIVASLQTVLSQQRCRRRTKKFFLNWVWVESKRNGLTKPGKKQVCLSQRWINTGRSWLSNWQMIPSWQVLIRLKMAKLGNCDKF